MNTGAGRTHSGSDGGSGEAAALLSCGPAGSAVENLTKLEVLGECVTFLLGVTFLC